MSFIPLIISYSGFRSFGEPHLQLSMLYGHQSVHPVSCNPSIAVTQVPSFRSSRGRYIDSSNN